MLRYFRQLCFILSSLILLTSVASAETDEMMVLIKCKDLNPRKEGNTYAGKASEEGISFGPQGLQIKFHKTSFEKFDDPSDIDCRSYYWNVVFEPDLHDGKLTVNHHYRGWNKLRPLLTGQFTYLGCPLGSSVESFDDETLWLRAIGQALTDDGPDIWVAGNFGVNTVSAPSCVVPR